MAKSNASLSPTTNILLIIVWGLLAAYLVFVAEPHVPVIFALVGAALGASGGVMQHLSIKEASNGFTNASSLLDVRRAFKTTSWGRRYIWWLYLSKLVLALLAFLAIRHPLLAIILGYGAGYFSLMLSREIVTLRDTFYLKRLSMQEGSASSRVE
jgi:hypothetical protein